MLKKINDLLAGVPATLVSGVFLVISFVLAKMGAELPVDPAWVAVIISGVPLLYLAIWRIIYNPGISKISSALLISIAMFAAIAIGDLFAAGEVAFIMALGAILEDMTTDRAKKGLKKLISLTPTQGRRIIEGQEERIAAEEICRNDILRILPGETIPVDGVIIKGDTSVDQSIMTGESLPIDKTVGDEVFCGTINRFGAIDIKETKVGEDSSLQKLIRMVQEAENKKTPTAIMAAIGQATKHGVIIKSGGALEKMGKVDTIAFDKTGTLTYGRLEVCDILSFDETLDERLLLSLAASAEAKSEHPLGKAIVSCARK